MSSKVEIILNNTPFPGAGQQIGGYQVIESMVDVEGKNWAIYIKGKLNQSQVKKALLELTNKHHALPVQDEYSLLSFRSKGMLHARTNPPGDVTVVRGHMYYARPNPISAKDFQAEMDEMIIEDPKKHFTKYIVNNTKELHERLWKGVTYAGEAYGWKKGNELWHRRASFIMPKIKINKALKGATMFYHTHPAKDEPSLTSADDIQFYLDLHFAYGIKSFYTIMKHKLDHFTITGKPGGKEKYLRMEEEAFIDTVDGMIEKGEQVAKKEVGKDRPEVEFQNRITREMVDLFNKKFKTIAKISFRPKSKNPASKLARKSSNNPIAALVNPAPNPPIKVDDKYIAKALDELKGLDYAHEHYGADEYGHTMYVYWWLKHHLAPTPKQPKGRLYKLQEYGLDQETRGKVRAYLSQPITGNYNYMDAVYLMALYHDIAKLREKGVKQSGWEIGAEMFRNEIGPELGLPSKLVEDIAFLFDTDLGRKGITDEDFRTQAGDYYGAAKLVQMSDMITHHPLMYTGSARKAKESGKIGMASGKQYKEYIMTELINDLRNFLDHHYVIQNPPPKVGSLKWVADYGIEDIPMQAAQELLGEFDQSVIPDNDGKTKPPGDRSSGGHLYRMRFNSSVVPGLTRYYAGNLSLSSSKLLIDVGRPVPDDLGKADVNLIYRAVGERLRESYPEVVIEEMEPEALVNPRHANKIQVISLSGPSGGGKSTVLRYLNKNIPNSSTPPTYTTRPRRVSDGKDRKFVSKSQFRDMIERGEFVEYTVSGAGHYYGRRFKDFRGNVAIIEVTLDGKKHYEKRFANVFTVYLDPDPAITEEERAKAIYRRGGITKEEAKRRAKKATETVARSKKMQFDLRVTMMKGKYHEGAKKVLSEVPLVNPSAEFTLLPTPYTHQQYSLDGTPLPLSTLEQRRNRQIAQYNARQQAAYDAKTHVPWHHMDRKSFVNGSILPPKWFHDRPSAYKYGLIPISSVSGMASLGDFSQNPPKDKFEWFKEWAQLVNMKNKEMKAFLNSPWFKVSGLTPKEAKEQGVRSGQNSFRAIIKMRRKLGITGPKGYVDNRKPRLLKELYTKALDKWSKSDWEWCKAQVSFNTRHGGAPYNKAKEREKGPLIRKQKTQNQPSARLLGLWVWAHDPWRWARKEKVASMPKCPNVPWVGMTEKRKYGVIEIIPGPRKNPKVRLKKDEYRSYFMDEEGNDLTSIPVESVKFTEGLNEADFGEPMTRQEALTEREGRWWRVNVSAYKGREPLIEVAPISLRARDKNYFMTANRTFYKNFSMEGPVFPTMLTHMAQEPSAILIVQGALGSFGEPELRSDITDWKGVSKGGGRLPVYESGEITAVDSEQLMMTFTPDKNELRHEAHIINRTKNFSEQVYVLRVEDKGDHYWLHEIQVSPKYRGQNWLRWGLETMLFNLVDRIPDYPDKKPVRTLARVVEGIPQKALVRVLEETGFKKIEEVDGGVLMEFDYQDSFEEVFANPSSRWGDEAKPVTLDENLQYMTYTGNTKLPHRLSYQLVKKLRSLIARDREYVGFVKDNKIYYGTSFGVHGVVSERTSDLDDAEFQFHTHPSGFRKGFHGVVSRADMRYACLLRMYQGLEWTLVVQKRGINIIQTAIREDSELYKAMVAGNENDWKSEELNDRFDSLMERDLEIITNTYNPYMPFRQHLYEEEMKVFHPNYHSTSELGQEVAFINTLNKFVKGFKFKMWYLEVPSEHWDWTEDMTEAFPLDDSEFSDVADWLRRPRQIRANPHYTPPPGIAMFPGELHQGPAALYQQTISISQLNPPRSKPFPWNKARVARSPFKTMKRAQASLKAWKEGRPIGFTATSSLKSMGKIPRASGKYELGEKYERINAHGGAHRVPKKYEGQDPKLHSDLFTDEDPEGTIQGLGFKDKATAEKSVNIIKRSGKTHAHKIQAAMAMEQRARFHPNQTPGIKAAQKVYAKFIEEMKRKTKERRNPNHCPIEAEARRAATDPSFKHHEWYIEHHLDYVMAIAKAIVKSDEEEDQQLIHDMVWMHDYPKMMGDKDNYELVRELVSKYRSERYTDRLMNQLRWMEAIKSPDWNGRTTTIAAVMSTADALSHYYGPFFQIFHDENPDTPIAELKKKNRAKLEKDKLKLRAGPRRTALDNVKLQYKGRKVRVVGNEHIAELIERSNPRTKKGRKFPSKYLKGLTATERAIAKYEIDRGYEYSMDDPEAYKDWKSDIKAKARGLKTLPSKWRNKFARKYGPLKKGYDFLDRMSKTTGVKRKYLKKIQDKGLAAWRVGHRPGVTPMQWARGRVYAFVMAAPSSTGPGKPDHKLAKEAGVR